MDDQEDVLDYLRSISRDDIFFRPQLDFDHLLLLDVREVTDQGGSIKIGELAYEYGKGFEPPSFSFLMDLLDDSGAKKEMIKRHL
jgi:hypothetical protein